MRLKLIGLGDLLRSLEAQADARITALLETTTGRFLFRPREHTGFFEELPERPVEALVRSGLQSMPKVREPLLRGFVERFGAFVPLTVDPDSPELGAFGFGPKVQRLLGSIDGRSLAELCRSRFVPEADARLTLYLLWACGVLGLEERPCEAQEELSRLTLDMLDGPRDAAREEQLQSALKRAIEQQPSSANMLVSMSLLLRRAGEPTKARALVERARQVDPEGAARAERLAEERRERRRKGWWSLKGTDLTAAEENPLGTTAR